MSDKNNKPITLKDSNFFIRIDNYMPNVFVDVEHLYLHQTKGTFEFKVGKRGATMFPTKMAMQMIKDLIGNGYKKFNIKAIDCYE